MMKEINYNHIEVPLEFKIACTVYRLDIQEVLQIFVDHISVYDSLTDQYSQGFTEATRTISSYIRNKVQQDNNGTAFLKCRDLAVSCINDIYLLARNKVGTAAAKRKKCVKLVDALYQAMERPHTSSFVLYLDENSPITLTKDFCVICELHNCYPKEFLEYFMSRISIAEEQARCGLKIKRQNYTYDFFLDIGKGFGRTDPEGSDLQDIEIEFYDRMEEVRLEVYNIRNLTERTELLRDFYLKHHQNMNPS